MSDKTKNNLLICGYCRTRLVHFDLIDIIEQYFQDSLIIWRNDYDDGKKMIEKVNINKELQIARYFMNGNCSMMIITTNGSLYCIGSNHYGQFGIDPLSNSIFNTPRAKNDFIDDPIKNDFFSNKQIKIINDGVYGNHNFIVCNDNDKYFYAFGENDYGQLGTNTINDSDPWYQLRTKILFKESVDSIKCGARHTLILSSAPNYNIYSCGNNEYGQLGLGDTIDRKQFTLIKKLLKIKCIFIECGINSSYVIDNTSSHSKSNVWAFGVSANGRLGLEDSNTNDQLNPIQIKYFIKNNIHISQISSGDRHVCCLSSLNDVYTFGHNRYGQCGNGTLNDQNIPFKLIFRNKKESNIKKIECGSGRTLLLDYNSNLYFFGEKGFGFKSHVLKPQLIPFKTLKSQMNDNNVQSIVDVKACCYSYLITN